MKAEYTDSRFLHTPGKPQACQLHHQPCQGHCFGGNLGLQGKIADLGIIVSGDCEIVKNEGGVLTLLLLKRTQWQGQVLGLEIAQSHQAPRTDWELQWVAKSMSAPRNKLGGWQHACPFRLQAVLVL